VEDSWRVRDKRQERKRERDRGPEPHRPRLHEHRQSRRRHERLDRQRPAARPAQPAVAAAGESWGRSPRGSELRGAAARQPADLTSCALPGPPGPPDRAGSFIQCMPVLRSYVRCRIRRGLPRSHARCTNSARSCPRPARLVSGASPPGCGACPRGTPRRPRRCPRCRSRWARCPPAACSRRHRRPFPAPAGPGNRQWR